MNNKLKKLLRPLVIPKSDKIPQNIIIGSVAGVNDSDSREFTAKITKFEIKLLAKYYIERLKSIDIVWDYGQSGSYEIRMYPFASTRIAEFEDLIGQEEVEKIFKKVYGDYKPGKNDPIQS